MLLARLMAATSYLQYMCPMGTQPHLYRSPRYLRCLHSFCKDCLENAVVPGVGLSSKKTIDCPACSATTQVYYTVENLSLNLRLARESKGAAVLAKIHSNGQIACEKCIVSDIARWFCLGCSQFICHDCELVHQRWRELVDHKRVSFEELDKLDVMSLLPIRPIRCSDNQHILAAVRLHGLEHRIKCYKCKNCRSGEDACQEIITASEENMKEMSNRLTKVTDAIKEVDEFIRKNREMQERLNKNAEQANVIITEAFDAVGDQQPGVTKEAVKADMESIATGKQTRLCLECEKMEKLRDRLFFKRSMVEELLTKYTNEEVMCAAKAFCDALDEVIAKYKSSLPLHVGETDFLKVIVDQSKNPFCKVSGGSCPEASVIITQQVCRGIVYTTRKLVVEARDESGYPYGIGGEEVTAKIYEYNKKEWRDCLVSDIENGQYIVCAFSHYCGKYDLHVNIRQQPIKGSPFNIFARREKSYYDSRLTPDPISLKRPGSVAPGDCVVFVCEYSGKNIYKIGLAWYPSGNDHVLQEIPVKGAKQLQGIAILHHKILFVTDGETNEVVKLTISGEVIARFGELGSQKGQFKRPTGIAVDEEGRIYVGEFYNNRVQIFNSDFSHQLTIPLEDQVQGIALDTSCNIHVTQQSRAGGRIKVFSPKGEYIRTYGMNNLREPRELYIDEEGYCLVTDSGYEPVKVFDSSGKFLRSFGAGLQSAQGICITPYGLHGPFFYVCDRDKQEWVRY